MNQEQAVRTLIKAASAGDYEAGVILNNWANEKQASGGVRARLRTAINQGLGGLNEFSKIRRGHEEALLKMVQKKITGMDEKKAEKVKKLAVSFANELVGVDSPSRVKHVTARFHSAVDKVLNAKPFKDRFNSNAMVKGIKAIYKDHPAVAWGTTGVAAVGAGAAAALAAKSYLDNRDKRSSYDEIDLEDYDYDEDEINQLKAASFVENLYASAYQNAYAEGLKTASAEWEQMALEDMGY